MQLSAMISEMIWCEVKGLKPDAVKKDVIPANACFSDLIGVLIYVNICILFSPSPPGLGKYVLLSFLGWVIDIFLTLFFISL